ncbi:7TM diverse intracellular signaling domain-containing protein [Shewanella sp. GutDb-MelDb]|uniref:7TM diverse intracellular signaling domain-containing protein n=1 Tax=Shewanella sp. GutDb-MelDb TaxID=2058316 RepID=UPI000C7A15A0|nr:7TM diverse intracellular signaling domain-containing protein [Shewanella sp. GutDb-MelDb]PKG57086.1 diguanylate cyclase [Shewanella sp. GutDb-MelDb]
MHIKIITITLLILSLFGSNESVHASAVFDHTFLFEASEGESFPQDFMAITPWIKSHPQLNKVSLAGGDYWMASAFVISADEGLWSVNVKNAIIESIDYWIIGEDGSKQYFHSGYYAPYEFLFDYARKAELKKATNYWLVTRINSRYYSSQPKLQVQPYEQHRLDSDFSAMFIVLCLGALVSIAFYNLLIYASIKDKAFLYYGFYVLTYFFGWALTFHIPAHLFGFHGLPLHHLFFIGLPIFNILFYKHFLQLPELSPRLWTLSKYLMWACIIALPTSIYLISYTAIIASILIMLWIALAITCGNVCLLKGFYPARYFIFAFTCLLLPAVLILPGNMGLMPDFFDNAELATLIGGTADALLLSLALAHKIRMLSDEKQRYIETLDIAWKNARIDELTKIANRFAFDEFMRQEQPIGSSAISECYLVLVTIEGLSLVNKKLGLGEGDKLICFVAAQLGRRTSSHNQESIFRIGVNDFVLFINKECIEDIELATAQIESHFSEKGFSDASLHVGRCLNTNVQNNHEWLRNADQNLYANKSVKRRQLYAQRLNSTFDVDV